jgi:hypothetical protein
MRKTAFLAAAAALLTATPAMAGGYVGLGYSNTDIDFSGSTEVDTWQGEAAVGFSGGGWGGQLGGSFGNLDFDSGGDADAWAVDGHLYWDGGAWRLGAVILHTDLDFGSGGGGSLDETVYGVEAMFNTSPNSNIFASLTTGEGEFLADYDVWNLDVGGNFYASPNVRIGGYVGTGNVDFGGIDSDTFSVGVNGEFQPWAVPVSLTAGWNYHEADDISLETNSFRIGARWNFGGGTLQERNNATPFTTRGGFLDRTFGVR